MVTKIESILDDRLNGCTKCTEPCLEQTGKDLNQMIKEANIK